MQHTVVQLALANVPSPYMCTLLFRAALPAADGKNANNLYLNALQFARADRRLYREGGAGAGVGDRVW